MCYNNVVMPRLFRAPAGTAVAVMLSRKSHHSRRKSAFAAARAGVSYAYR